MVTKDLAGKSAALLLLLAMLAGCSREEKTASGAPARKIDTTTPVQGDWVVQRISTDPDTLNYLTGQDTTGLVIRNILVGQGLLQQNNFNLKFDPCLAESYEVSPDQLTYTFHLRHGVKWHDGVPFTADDVKYTFDRIKDPKVDCAAIRVYFTDIKSCEVLDPYTVRYTASQRYFKTLEVLGTFASIVPKHVFEKGEPDFNKHPFGRAPIGTGPYKFVRWDTGSDIVLERNDDYWGPKPYPKRIVYQLIQEPSVAAQLLKKGEIDVFDGVSPVQWERQLKGSRSMTRCHEIVYPYPAYSYLGFNLRQPIFGDIAVRHAIDLLIPRDEIMKRVAYNKYSEKISGYDSPSSVNYNHDVAPTAYDPAQAAQMLDAAGWKNDHGDGIRYKNGQPLEFTLLYPAGGSTAEKVAEMIQESLAKDGIVMKLSRLEFAQLISLIDDWKYDAVLTGWSLDLNGDPSQLWSSSESVLKKSSNFIGFSNAAADQLIAAGKLEYDDEKRGAIYRQLHKLIHDQYPVCFLFCPKEIMVVSDRFQDVKTFAPRPCFDVSSWWVPRPLQKFGL